MTGSYLLLFLATAVCMGYMVMYFFAMADRAARWLEPPLPGPPPEPAPRRPPPLVDFDAIDAFLAQHWGTGAVARA